MSVFLVSYQTNYVGLVEPGFYTLNLTEDNLLWSTVICVVAFSFALLIRKPWNSVNVPFAYPFTYIFAEPAFLPKSPGQFLAGHTYLGW
jgi:hypothetical protein